jgi:hypothetical protein
MTSKTSLSMRAAASWAEVVVETRTSPSPPNIRANALQRLGSSST